MFSHNEISILGNVGADPEFHEKKVTFRVCTTDGYMSKETKKWVTITQWHNVVVWNHNLFDSIEKYVKKGSKVLVRGKFRTSDYETAKGVEKTSMYIEVSFNDKIVYITTPGAQPSKPVRSQNNNLENPFPM